MAREIKFPFIFYEEGVTTELYSDGREQVFREYVDPNDPRRRIVNFKVDTLTGKGPRTVIFERRWDSYEQRHYEIKVSFD